MNKSQIITISDGGQVNIPTSVAMRDFEIAEMLGVRYSVVRALIKRLLKSRHFRGCGDGYEIQRDGLAIPEYFELEIIVAIAFQIDSYEAEIFSRFILKRVTNPNILTLYIGNSREYV